MDALMVSCFLFVIRNSFKRMQLSSKVLYQFSGFRCSHCPRFEPMSGIQDCGYLGVPHKPMFHIFDRLFTHLLFEDFNYKPLLIGNSTNRMYLFECKKLKRPLKIAMSIKSSIPLNLSRVFNFNFHKRALKNSTTLQSSHLNLTNFIISLCLCVSVCSVCFSLKLINWKFDPRAHKMNGKQIYFNNKRFIHIKIVYRR